MRIGFFTAALAEQPLEEVARWAAGAGYSSLEIDVERHVGQPSQSATAVDTVRGAGLDVCALTFFGNLLAADRTERERARTMVEAIVDAAGEKEVGLVVIFPGRNEAAPDDENYRELAAYLVPLTERAATRNVRICMENWPGPRKDYVATTPAGWARLFELVPVPNLGLTFDPSHLIWQGIDPDRALRAVADRVFLAHAKDTEIFSERLQQVGHFGSDWWTYRLPGHGQLDWRRWLALLHEVGFDGAVSVEHEDAGWGWPEGTVEQRQAGLVEALHVLRAALPSSTA